MCDKRFFFMEHLKEKDFFQVGLKFGFLTAVNSIVFQAKFYFYYFPNVYKKSQCLSKL